MSFADTVLIVFLAFLGIPVAWVIAEIVKLFL